MALSTRQQLDSEFLTEPELEYSILTYLSLKDLLVSKFVSHSWHTMINQLPWEEIFRRDPQKQSHFIKALVHSIRQQEYEQIHYWINLGAEFELNFNDRYTGRDRVQVEYSVEEWGLYAHFENPTVLSIASNLLSGKPGAKVICSLLYNNANPLITSKYSGTQAIGEGEFCTAIHYEGDDRPSKTACDNGIKAILGLAEMEDELLHFVVNGNVVLSRLEKAIESRSYITIEYFNRLLQQRGVDFNIRGISRDLKSTDKVLLLNMAGFHRLYQDALHPSFFWDHWQYFLAGSLGALWSACLFSDKTILLGKCIIGLVTTATTGSLVPLLIGSIILGVVIGLVCALLKKSWDHYSHITLDELYKKENLPQKKPTSIHLTGQLFFKGVCVTNKIIKMADEEKSNPDNGNSARVDSVNDLEVKHMDDGMLFLDNSEFTTEHLSRVPSKDLQTFSSKKIISGAFKEEKYSEMIKAREAWIKNVPKKKCIDIEVIQDGEESRGMLPTSRIGSMGLLN